jgi:hypothetical protein
MFFGESGSMAEPKTPPSSVPTIPPEADTRIGNGPSGPVTTLSPPDGNRGRHSPTATERWTHRITVLLFVFLCAVIGVLLVILPWRAEWTDNHLLAAYPNVRMIVGSAFARGICSGLGILDIWIGFWEAIHYHED